MNLEESDQFLEKQKQTEQRKKIVLVFLILCAILLVLLVALIIFIEYKDSLELKMFIDGKQVNISESLLYQEDDLVYINVKSLSEMLGYTYTKGEYEQYNEDINSCYIKNDLEIVAMTVGSNIFTKYIEVAEDAPVLTPEGIYGIEMKVEAENGESDIFVIEQTMKLVNNEIYMPFNLVTDVFNVLVNTSEQNRIRIYTLPTLFKNAMQVAAKLGYSNISGIYENIRALPYGIIVVGDNNIFGTIDSNTGEQVLSIKYENLLFIQNAQEFFIKGEDTVGLLDKNGNTIIKPTAYDEMSILDEIEQLYLVKKDGKYGVLNRKGEILIHVDYDKIGLRNIEDFDIEDIRNPYLLYDKYIIVELDAQYGLFNIDGEELLKPVYETFGYKTTETDVAGEESVLLIPSSVGIKGIVVKLNGLYGIYDTNVKSLIIPCSCSRIYSITKAAETKYYMEFAGQQIELEGFLYENTLKSENIEETQNEVVNQEVIVEENQDVEGVEGEIVENQEPENQEVEIQESEIQEYEVVEE